MHKYWIVEKHNDKQELLFSLDNHELAKKTLDWLERNKQYIRNKVQVEFILMENHSVNIVSYDPFLPTYIITDHGQMPEEIQQVSIEKFSVSEDDIVNSEDVEHYYEDDLIDVNVIWS